MDESPFESRYGLYLRETGQRAHEEDDKPERLQLGTELEPAILQIWAKREGRKIEHNRTAQFFGSLISATPDGFDTTTQIVETVDAKTVQPWERRDWLEGVPRYYWWQVQQQTLCWSAPAGWIVALFGVQELAGTRIEADHKAHDAIVREAATFWKQVRGEIPPPPPDEHRSSVAGLMAKRRESKTIDFGDARIAEMMATIDQEYTEARAALKDAKKREQRAKARLLAALGDADRGTFPDGHGYAIQWQVRRGYTTKDTKFPQLVTFTGSNTEDGEIEE